MKPSESTVRVRFYGPLDEIKARNTDGPEYRVPIFDRRTVKDLIESEGVPHTEVALVMVNGSPAGLDHIVSGGDRVSVFPLLTRLSGRPADRHSEGPKQDTGFVADVHLGKLARRLRLLGLDCAYGNALSDEEIADLSAREARTVLTRDRQLLMRRTVISGIFIRSGRTDDQVLQVLERLSPLPRLHPYTRCLECNGLLEEVPPERVSPLLPPRTQRHVTSCVRCMECGKVYWQGSHWRAIKEWVGRTLQQADAFRAWDNVTPRDNAVEAPGQDI